MKKLAFALAAVVAVTSASGAAWGQGRDRGPGGHPGAAVGAHRGGSWHGGNWHGGGGYRGHPGWHGPRVGFYFGSPFLWGPSYWGYPYPYPYYAPYPVTYSYRVAVDEPIYVDPAPETSAPGPVNWYYCTDPAGYFPYVQNCSKPWMTVVPPRGPNPSAPAQ